MHKNNLLIMFSGMPIAIFLGLIIDFRFPTYINSKSHLLLFFSYGGIVSFDRLDLFLTLLFSIPFIFQVLLFSNDLHRDFSTASVYIFTRRDTRNKWLYKKCINLEMKLSIYYLIQFFTIIFISAIIGYAIDLKSAIIVIFMLFLTLINMNNLWILVGCVLTIKKSSILVISGILAIYIGWIFMLPVIKDLKILIKAIPITRSLLSIHEFVDIQSNMPVIFTIYSTLLWGITARCILYFLTTKWIKNTDLI